MAENQFKLQDKTAIVCGPLNSLVQSISTALIELGSDVALLGNDPELGLRFVNNLSGLREMHQKYGRAATFEMNATAADTVKAAISRVPELFGGVDIFIDTHLTTAFPPFEKKPNTDYEATFKTQLEKLKFSTEAVLNFLEGRKRGRMIYLLYGLECSSNGDDSLDGCYREFISYFHKIATQALGVNITVNTVAAGITEDYLLHQFPRLPSLQKARESIAQTFPRLKVVTPVEISDVVSFLAGTAGGGLNGQVIHVNGGLKFS